MAKRFTTQDVAAHNKPNDLYIVVDEDVYDLTKFQDEHPGMFSLALSSLYNLSICHNLNQRPNADIVLIPRRKEDPHPRCRKRRLEAILEISQRRHPEKVQIEAPSRLSKHQGRRTSSRSTGQRREEGEEGDREAQGRERGRGSCPCCYRGGDFGSIWGSHSIR